jgi:hypothetical protein
MHQARVEGPETGSLWKVVGTLRMPRLQVAGGATAATVLEAPTKQCLFVGWASSLSVTNLFCKGYTKLEHRFR